LRFGLALRPASVARHMASAPPRATDISPGTENDRSFFGHPKGLATLFFTEMWERFSYYGMRAFLTLYMIASAQKGGMGLTAANAGIVYGLYQSSVYLMSLPGGWIADRFWGQRKAIFVGGVLITLGHVALSLPALPGVGPMVESLPANATFYAGLALIVLGTGLLKPNISTVVGLLYGKTDPRRDAGFTIFYMGINLGALIAPLTCGALAQQQWFRDKLVSWNIDPNHAWHFGFGLAAVGMAAGLIWFTATSKHLGKVGLPPAAPTEPAVAKKNIQTLWVVLAGVVGVPLMFIVLISLDVLKTKSDIANVFGVGLFGASIVMFTVLWKQARDASERKRLVAMIVLFIGCIAFFGVFEQAGGMLNIFTEQYAKPTLLGVSITASWYQSINSGYVVMLAPIFAALWFRLAKANREPTPVTKFGIGMLLNALAFVVLLPALSIIDEGSKISPGFLFGLYLFSTMAEMCVSPVGLASMSRLAPARMASMVMGIWFLAIANGVYLAGRAGEVAEKQGKWFLFLFLIALSAVIGVILLFVAKPVKAMLATDAGDLPDAKASDAA
jgi:proton-dependent oligopeptide transporter, POT family